MEKKNKNNNFGRRAYLGIGICIGMLCIALVPLGLGKNNDCLLKSPAGRLNMSAPHPVININGNPALLAFPNKTGIGSETDPIIIENLEIDAGGAPSTSCILILNTNLHLVIRNCTLTGATDTNMAGIYLSNCTNVEVTGCSIDGNYSIVLEYCDDSKVFLNNLNDGIYVDHSNNTMYWGNNVSGVNGDGIFIVDCINITIIGNIFFNCEYGVGMFPPGGYTVVLNLIFNNSDYGIHYLDTATGNTITDNWLWNNGYDDFYNEDTGNSTEYPDNNFKEYPYPIGDFLDNDYDGDGLSNREEIMLETDPISMDTDGDNVMDGAEVFFGTNPLVTDTDGDGIDDFEIHVFDSDLDGITDYLEIYVYETSPTDSDTDGDGFSDGVEIAAGTDPTSATSYPSESTDNTNLYIMTALAIIAGVAVVLCITLFLKVRALSMKVTRLEGKR
ncbi:MAG: right-handed parallel beta-helix repeat-containing protein [Candidatus Hodarchaeota archaeon]